MAITQSSPTSTWDTIQNVFYRKDEIYSMGWKVPDLSDYLYAVARNGGPIALMRDERKVMLLGKHSAGKPKINIYSSSGIHLSTITWDLTQPVLIHFTPTHLLVVSDEGLYRLYDLSNPASYTQHSLGSEVTELGVVSGKGYDDGFVVLTGGLQFMEVRGWKGGRVGAMAASGLTEPPHSWTIISPEQSTSGHTEILVSTGTTIITLDALDRIDQRLSRGPFSHILLSPNGRFLALITASNILWVVSADFQRNMSEVDISTIDEDLGRPESIEWCGDNALVLGWGGRVVVVGPGGDSLSYDYSPSAILVGEVDGLRIISSTTCDFLQKVPDSSLAVFSPGSSHPASVLYDALEHFDAKSPKADEAIRSIRPDLANAVDTCIEAAGREVDTYWQKRLLKAAQFGRAFMDLYNPSEFVAMGQTLKVLNAVRYFEVGIPITYEQYISTSPSSLITALISRNLHLLALRITQHLSLRPDPVLKHWASAKIQRSKPTPDLGGGSDDDILCREIVAKFKAEGEGSVSYAEIARGAYEGGRSKLATMLLDYEPRAAEQVPLLLQMKEEKIALVKAIDSGDTDLVYQVLLHLRSTLSPGDFFHVLDDSISPNLTPAVKLLQVYARQGDKQLLRDFYYQDDRRTENACLELEEAGSSANPEKRVDHLQKAAKFFGEHKDRAFEAKMAEDAKRLLSLQMAYERELGHKFLFAGLSVNDFIYTLLCEGLGKRAEKVRADWRVPDKRFVLSSFYLFAIPLYLSSFYATLFSCIPFRRLTLFDEVVQKALMNWTDSRFWWIKIKALARNKDWEGLEAFAKSKKSPIGYEPFVTHLLSLTPPHPAEAAKFVARCEPKSRVDLYVKCGDWAKAAESAEKDRGKLEQLRRSAPNGIAQREVDEVIRRLK